MSKPTTQRAVLVVTSLFIILAVGWTIAWRFWVYDNVHAPLQRRAAAMTQELKAEGARVEEPQAAEKIPGVEQVIALQVDGQRVRLLQFKSSDPELQRVHNDHTTRILGKDQPAEDEDVIVIIDFEDHPIKDRILKSFHKK